MPIFDRGPTPLEINKGDMYQKPSKMNHRGLFIETDPVALQRTALALKNYLEHDLPLDGELNESAHGVSRIELLKVLLPMCGVALSGQMQAALDIREVPYAFYSYPIREGLFPEKLARLIKNFQLEAEGYGTELAEPVEINGERFCLREFEELGDWPEKIRAAEDQRRRQEMGDRYVPVNSSYYSD